MKITDYLDILFDNSCLLLGSTNTAKVSHIYFSTNIVLFFLQREEEIKKGSKSNYICIVYYSSSKQRG